MVLVHIVNRPKHWPAIEIAFYHREDDEWIEGGGEWPVDGRVTHWMPLPAAPEQEATQ